VQHPGIEPGPPRLEDAAAHPARAATCSERDSNPRRRRLRVCRSTRLSYRNMAEGEGVEPSGVTPAWFSRPVAHRCAPPSIATRCRPGAWAAGVRRGHRCSPRHRTCDILFTERRSDLLSYTGTGPPSGTRTRTVRSLSASALHPIGQRRTARVTPLAMSCHPLWSSQLPSQPAEVGGEAGATGLEPATRGFGDRCSTS
jgi:hypothetical protein